jgi:hypothetical protein
MQVWDCVLSLSANLLRATSPTTTMDFGDLSLASYVDVILKFTVVGLSPRVALHARQNPQLR